MACPSFGLSEGMCAGAVPASMARERQGITRWSRCRGLRRSARPPRPAAGPGSASPGLGRRYRADRGRPRRGRPDSRKRSPSGVARVPKELTATLAGIGTAIPATAHTEWIQPPPWQHTASAQAARPMPDAGPATAAVRSMILSFWRRDSPLPTLGPTAGPGQRRRTRRASRRTGQGHGTPAVRSSRRVAMIWGRGRARPGSPPGARSQWARPLGCAGRASGPGGRSRRRRHPPVPGAPVRRPREGSPGPWVVRADAQRLQARQRPGQMRQAARERGQERTRHRTPRMSDEVAGPGP